MGQDKQSDSLLACQQGIAAEFKGELAQALACYQQAWELARSAYEKAVAAHYLGHLAENPQAALVWHQTALEHAQQAPPEAVEAFWASLYVNLGDAYEQNKQAQLASDYYARARKLGLEHSQRPPRRTPLG